MNSKVEKTENANEVKIEITVEAQKFDEAIKRVYFKTVKYFNIPGFRKGKAPMNIIEKYYGKEIFYEDTFNEVAQEAYEEALKENKLEVVSRPDIDITQIGKGQDLIFTAVVQTKPEVELGKYKGIEIPKIEYTVSDHDIEHELYHMQERNSRLVTIEDRAVENGDIAVIDFEGFVDGVAFDGGKAENHELEIGSGSFIPGFEDQVVGMKIDEEKDVVVTFPQEYFSKELAGKEATFKVKLHEIKKKELPELDDEFAKDVSEFDTLEELKNSIKEKIEKENEQKTKYETEDAAIKAVCENIKVEIPSGMVEMETENMLKDIETRLSYQGLKLEQYLQMLGKTAEEIKKEYEPQAIEAIKSRLTLEAIIKAEKIEATDEDINAKIKEMAENYGKKEDELKDNENLKSYIKSGVESEKAIDFIVKNAKIKEEKKETKKATKTEKTEKVEKETKSKAEKKSE
jgi:trigger factor